MELSVISNLFKKLSDTVCDPVFQTEYKIRDQSFTRNRKLNFEKIMLFILGLHQNSLPTAIDEFIRRYPEKEVELFTKQALSKARQQISSEAFHRLLHLTVSDIKSQKIEKRWNGYKILAIDGTTIQLPETKINKEYFDANKNRSDGKRQETTMAKASALFDVTNDLIIDAVIGKRYDSERTQASILLKSSPIDLYDSKTIILFDRGYPANALYSFFYKRNGLFLMRVSEQSYRSTKEMPLGDHIVDFTSNGELRKLRIIKFQLDEDTVETLATNVLDENITVAMMKQLYFLRWGIECKFKELKSVLKIENFSGTTPVAILQDFYATLTMSNVIAWMKSYLDRQLEMKEYISRKQRKYQTNRCYLAGLISENVCRLLRLNLRLEILKKIANKAARQVSIIREGRSFERNPSRAKSHITFVNSRRTSM